jgi:hypothetical protein
MVVELKEISFKSQAIEDLFQELEKIKEHEFKDVTPFKGGLSQVPLVVGLVGKLPDGINNLISKFVGLQSKAVKELKEHFEKHRDYGERWLRGMVDPNFDEVRYRLWCVHCYVLFDARKAKVDKKHGWIGRFINKQFDGRISKNGGFNM